MSTDGPRRWLSADSDASDSLRAVLDSARDDDDAKAFERLEAKVAPLFGAGAGAAVGAGGAGGATGAGAAKLVGGKLAASKLLLLIGSLATVSAVGVVIYRSAQPDAEVSVINARDDGGSERARTTTETETDTETDTDSARTSSSVDESVEATVPRGDSLEEEASVGERRHRHRTASHAVTETESGLQDEVALLNEVQRTVTSNPQRALRLLSEHRRRFPHGALVQERQVFTIEALVAAGRVDEARRQANRFLAAHPRSSHAARIRRILP